MENYTIPRDDRLLCRCGCGHNVKQALRDALSRLEKELGRPLLVTSGARCQEHNRRVSGAKSSLHLSGMAVDVVSRDVQDQLDILREARLVGFRGFGRSMSGTYIHLDLGIHRPAWAYDKTGRVVSDVLRW